MSVISLLLLATQLGASSECSVVTRRDAVGFGTLTLELVDLVDDDWPTLCGELARYLDLGPPPYGTASATDAQKLLSETGYFERVDCQPASDGRRISCRAHPEAMVRRASVRGHVPFTLLQRDLERRLFLRSGTLLDAPTSQLEQQRQRLERFLEEDGYFASHVTLKTRSVEGAEPNRGVDLTAVVEAGRGVKLREVRVHGEPYLPLPEIRKHFVHYWLLFFAQARFKPRELEDDIDSLTKTYQELGFAEARVRGEYRLDMAAGAVDLDLTIDTGPRVVYQVIGAEAVNVDDLTALATFSLAGVVDAVELENTRRAIIERYQRDGYYDVKVEAQLDEHSIPGSIVVNLRITEGPRASLEEVVVEGNEHMRRRTLLRRAQLVTQASGFFSTGRWVDAWVAHDVQALEAVYRAAGFPNVVVSARRELRQPGELTAVFTITEGAGRKVASLVFDGLPPPVDEEELERKLTLRQGKPYDPNALLDDERAILTSLAQVGYLQAKLQREVGGEKSPTGDVSIAYTVDAGERAFFGGYLVRGNLRTVRGLIGEQLELEPGDPVNLEVVGAAERRMRELGVFTSVDLVPLGTWRRKPKTWLLVAVEERDQRTLDAVGSYATDERFAVGGDYRDRNLFGRAVRLDIGLRYGNARGLVSSHLRIGNVDRLSLVARAPRPLGLPFDVQTTGGYIYEDQPIFRERKVGGTLAAVRQWFEREDCLYCASVNASVGYELTSTLFTPKVTPEKRFDTVDRGTIGRIVPEVGIDRRDSFTDPRSGFSASLRFELALPALGLGLNRVAGFTRFVATADGYLPLAKTRRERLVSGSTFGGPVVLALGGQYGVIEGLQGLPLPASETFAYGGDASVRGLKDRASAVSDFGAPYLTVLSGEVRWYLWQSASIGTFQVAAFTDLGTVANSRRDLFAETTVSVGPVLRYVTPVGPISLAYGKPIIVADGISSSGRVHFSFGYNY